MLKFCHAGQAISKKTLRVLAESLQVFDQNSHFLIVYTTKHIYSLIHLFKRCVSHLLTVSKISSGSKKTH